MTRIGIALIAAGALAWAGPDDLPAPATGAKAEPAREDSLLTAAKLRERVKTMRKNVLGGGPAVEESEKEALRFYRRKLEQLARRTDDLHVQRDMKEAEYNVALDATLKSGDPGERKQAARDANRLRTEVRGIDADIAAMERQGESLGRGLAAIRTRMDQRKRMLARFDREPLGEELPYLGDDVLGLEEEADEAKDPFMDEELLMDLMRRDPAKARELIFKHYPQRYWQLFPLNPPADELKKAIPFPAPDLPEKR